MATVTFFGKPGCAGNRRQMALLRASGHLVNEQNLLTEPWTERSLGAFLGDLAVTDWFNRSATRVKAGEVQPDTLDADTAMAMLLADPLLIRRPLMEVEGVRSVGWDADRIARWIGLADGVDHGGEGCVHADAGRDRGQPSNAATCPPPGAADIP